MDHTCYTVDTVGYEGYLKLLPIYLDHIFNPLLTLESMLTEIHHVNEHGEDAGVAFSEIQGIQNMSSSLATLELQRLMYPQGNPYRSETGGLMDTFRDIELRDIVEYHDQHYTLHNTCIFISGYIDFDRLEDVIHDFEIQQSQDSTHANHM